MRLYTKVAALSVAGLLALGMTSSVSADTNRVALCHFTSSPQMPFVVIEVPEAAVPAHLAHGDSRVRGDKEEDKKEKRPCRIKQPPK